MFLPAWPFPGNAKYKPLGSLIAIESPRNMRPQFHVKGNNSYGLMFLGMFYVFSAIYSVERDK